MAWTIWVVSSRSAYLLPLPPTGEVCLGAGTAGDTCLHAEGVAPRHLLLRIAPQETLEAIPLAPTLLNDVQLSGASRLRSGDELVVGAARLLVWERRSQAAARATPRREYEPARRGAFLTQAPLSLLLARVPEVRDRETFLARWLSLLPEGALASELGASTLEVLLPGVESTSVANLRASLAAAGSPRVQSAAFPEDGDSLEQVLEVAFSRFLEVPREPPEDAFFAEPLMLRLLAAIERSEGGWVLAGEPGVGKETLARLAHAREGVEGPFVVRAAPSSPEGLARLAQEVGCGTLYLDARSGFARPWAEWVEAARPFRRWFLATPEAPVGASHVLPVPPLRDRPRDVLPLADAFLARFGRAAGRSALALSPGAREALVAHAFPGNTRELKNALTAAALTSPGAEISADSLPVAVAWTAMGSRQPANLRTALDEAEREALLATLSRTRWNVTRAAQVLGIPRRTVVYRMARLGLKRPERSQ